METMESTFTLQEAAVQGNVTALFELLRQDPLILEKIVMNGIAETPLHIATLLGHEDFVKEVLHQKPELAKELDSRRSSPLHVASLKGYVDIVKMLLRADKEMCFARDVEGRNPLHLAAMKGQVDVLEELISAKPLAARARTNWGETIFHVCVKHGQFEALKFLMERENSPEYFNLRDNYGMTILHLAVADKQIEVIKFLTSNISFDINAVNAFGFTALDLSAQNQRDMNDWAISKSLRLSGAVNAKDIELLEHEDITTKTKSSTSKARSHNRVKQEKSVEKFENKQEDWLERKRNAIMIVASLIATMAFDAVLETPKELQELADRQHKSNNLSLTPPTTNQYPFDVRVSFFGLSYYDSYLVFNAVGLLASLSIIMLLISGLPIKRRFFMWLLMLIMWFAISAMTLTYMVSLVMRAPSDNLLVVPVILIGSYIWIGLIMILLLGHTIRLIVKMIKYFIKLTKGVKGKPSRLRVEDLMQYPEDQHRSSTKL